MKKAKPQNFRLLVTISVLFSTLIIVFGLFFGRIIYKHTSNMLIGESKQYFSKINEELSLDFLATRRTVNQTVHILSRTEITSAKSLAERLRFVPVFLEALQQEPQLSGLQVGYENGDYFIVRPVISDYMREQFNAPPHATIVVDNISTGEDGKRYLKRLWYSDSLVELNSDPPAVSEYDPRIRPWYKAALSSNKDVRTEPYLFHFIQQMGITIAYNAPDSGAVVASGAGVYTAENIVIPADAYIISIAGYSDGNFDAATTAVMDVGDGTDPDAYIDAQDVKSAGALTLTAGAAGLLGYSASARTISSSITTDGTSTAVGEATLRVDYMMMQSSTEAGKIAVGLDS